MASRPRDPLEVGKALDILAGSALWYMQKGKYLVVRAYSRDWRETEVLKKAFGGGTFYHMRKRNLEPPITGWQISKKEDVAYLRNVLESFPRPELSGRLSFLLDFIECNTDDVGTPNSSDAGVPDGGLDLTLEQDQGGNDCTG